MIVCLFDFESTGIDTKTARITEIGAILVDSSTWEVTNNKIFECYVYDNTYPKQSQEVVRVTGITDQVLLEKGIIPKVALTEFLAFSSVADYLIAYNVQYDRGLLEAELDRNGITGTKQNYLCGLKDVDYPEHYKCRKLSHLSLDHGISVDPSKLHRAVGDVTLMAELFKKGGYKLEDMVCYKSTPYIVIQALVNYDNRELAKEQRFSWEKAGDTTYPKSWVKVIKQNTFEAEKAKCGFEIRQIRVLQ